MWQELSHHYRTLREQRKKYERRRDYYERIKISPTKFFRVQGQQCEIHWEGDAPFGDPSPLFPWKGDVNNLIDRFDVRAHMDEILAETNEGQKEEDTVEEKKETLTEEERSLNYERYRILARNSFMHITETSFLKKIKTSEEKNHFGRIKHYKRHRVATGIHSGETQCNSQRQGVTIGYNYDQKPNTNQGMAAGYNYDHSTAVYDYPTRFKQDNSDCDNEEDFLKRISKMKSAEIKEINQHGSHFGMHSNDFYSFIVSELEEAEQAKAKKRRERKQRLPKKYHRSPEPEKTIADKEKVESKSTSKKYSENITYITSFGKDDPSSSNRGGSTRRRSEKTRSPEDFAYSRRSVNSYRYKRRRSSSESSSSSESYRKNYDYGRSFRSSSNSKSKSSDPLKTSTRDKQKPASMSTGSSVQDSRKINSSPNFTKTKACKKSCLERLKMKTQDMLTEHLKADQMAEQLRKQRAQIEEDYS